MRDFLNLIEQTDRPSPTFLQSLSEDSRVSSFAQWFAGSKCVNEDGTPKRMYHGTGAGDIRAFDVSKVDQNGLYGPGFYFTDSPDVAGSTGKVALDPSDPWEAIDASARFQQAGYAFQRAKFEVPPLTKKQMAYAKRLFLSNGYIDDANRDIGTRRSYNAGCKAWNEGPEAMAKWLVADAPDWFIKKLKVEKRRTTTPVVIPVYLSIKNPFDMSGLFHRDQVKRLIPLLLIDPEKQAKFIEFGESRLQQGAVTGHDLWTTVKGLLRVGEPSHFEGEAKNQTNLGLQRAGFDGIRHEGGQIVATFGEHDVWIAFHPNQIKSVYARSHTGSPNIDESEKTV
jgi:hypothetical protein